MSELEHTLASVLAVVVVALVVRLSIRNHERLSYASVLVAVGLLASVSGVSPEVRLTDDLVLMVLLPAILFEGTISLDVDRLRRNAPLVVLLTVLGLPFSIVLLGAAGTAAFGFPALVAMLFAAVILPTDPAAVLSLFDEFDVSERLAVTIEGESLLNDGVAIVIFTTLLGTVTSADGSLASLASPAGLAGVALDVVLVGGGGMAFGLAVGYAGHQLLRRLTDRTAMLLLTVVVAYGSFLVGEAVLGVSGVLSVVGAGLLMGAHEQTHEAVSEQEYRVEDVWTTAGTLVTTVLYVLIGTAVPPAAFGRHADLVLVAAALVVVVRALTIYPLVTLANAALDRSVPRNCQHIMVWGGLHTVVPVALALSLPPGFAHREEMQTMVFGVAVLSIVVQGLLMPAVLDRVGLAGSGQG